MNPKGGNGIRPDPRSSEAVRFRTINENGPDERSGPESNRD